MAVNEKNSPHENENRKKLYRNLGIALLSSFSIVAIFLIFSRDGASILSKMLLFSPLDIAVEFGIFFLIFVVDSARTVVIGHFLGEKVRWSVALSNSILGYFFTYITPFSAGGQPYQIYHLSKWKMSAENSSAIILTRWSNMLIFLSAASLFLLRRYLPYIKVGIPLISQMLWVIIIASMAVSMMIVLFFLIPGAGIGITGMLGRSRFIARIMKIFKKDSNEIFDGLEKRLENFYDAMHTIWGRKPWLVVFDGLMGILDLGLLYYALYRAITLSSAAAGVRFDLSFWNLSAIFILLSFIVYYVPTPGSSGGVEGGFYAVLSMYGGKAAVMAGVLMWRVATYYIPILVGFIVMMLEVRRNPG